MKKVLFCGAVLLLALAATAFAGREEAEAAIEAYEAVVVEVEALAEKDFIIGTDEFAELDEKVEAANEAVSAIEEEQEWLIQDAKRIAEFRERFNKAMAEIIQKSLKY